jgi:outer membrane protein assembly factor BamB
VTGIAIYRGQRLWGRNALLAIALLGQATAFASPVVLLCRNDVYGDIHQVIFDELTDSFGNWAGWVYAIDADTGVWKWRLKSNYPIQSGMTPTAGSLVFFGDMGGTFYVLDAADGRRLCGQKIGGAIGGGVITYTANGAQKVAVAVGFTSILWPTEVATGKIVILGLGQTSASLRWAASFTPTRR